MKDWSKITADELLEAKMNGTPPLQIIHQMCIEGEGAMVAQKLGIFMDINENPTDVLKQMCKDGCIDNAIEYAGIFATQGMTGVTFVDTICAQGNFVATLIKHYDELFASFGIDDFVLVALLCKYDYETVQDYRDYLIHEKEIDEGILTVNLNHAKISCQTQ